MPTNGRPASCRRPLRSSPPLLTTGRRQTPPLRSGRRHPFFRGGSSDTRRSVQLLPAEVARVGFVGLWLPRTQISLHAWQIGEVRLCSPETAMSSAVISPFIGSHTGAPSIANAPPPSHRARANIPPGVAERSGYLSALRASSKESGASKRWAAGSRMPLATRRLRNGSAVARAGRLSISPKIRAAGALGLCG